MIKSLQQLELPPNQKRRNFSYPWHVFICHSTYKSNWNKQQPKAFKSVLVTLQKIEMEFE